MRFAAALVLISFAAMGQSPPPEVDQALRARVSEFYGYHVTGNFKKAFDMVAEDTKDYYFAAQKNTFISFTVGDITYSDNFTKAVVNVIGKQKMRPRPQFPEIVIDAPMISKWKIEDGKWVWYVPQKVDCPTPMSCGVDGKPRAQDPAAAAADPAAKLPDLSQKAIDKQAQQILNQSRVDRPLVTMSATSPTSERVMFHNGQAGFVRVFIDPGPPVEGFTASIEKTDVGTNQDVAVTLRYEPGKTPPPPAGVIVKLYVEPLKQLFQIAVKFAK
jgi:hypothetical protein